MKRSGIIGWTVIWGLLFTFIGFSFTSAQTPKSAEVPIANVASFSGPYAGYGQRWNRGIKFFLDETNEAGGILISGVRYKFRLINYDDRMDPSEGVRATSRAIEEDKVNYIFGSTSYTVARPMMDVTRKANAMQLVMTGTAAATETGHPRLIRTIANIDSRAEPFVKYLIKRFNPKKVLIVAQKYEYGLSQEIAYKKAFEAKGITLLSEIVALKETDFYPQWGKIKGMSDVDLILACPPGGFWALLSSRVPNLGLKCPAVP